jgi:hypothetical protein
VIIKITQSKLKLHETWLFFSKILIYQIWCISLW